jgi:hypothetical protein
MNRVMINKVKSSKANIEFMFVVSIEYIKPAIDRTSARNKRFCFTMVLFLM